MRARRSRMMWGGICGAASLVIGCGYPALPRVGDHDGGPDDGGGSAATSPVTLDWQVSQPPPAAPSFTSMSPAPKIRIAPMFAAGSSGDANAALAPFVDATYNADGTIAVPRDYLAQTWRLEYTLADGVPHEVQWHPDNRIGHLAIPSFGRPARLPVPAGAGYTIQPTNAPASFTNPHVFTTGLWTEGFAPPTGTTLDYDLVNSLALSGAMGLPDPAYGDQGVVIDYASQAGCLAATGGAVFDPTVHAGVRTTVTPAWNISPFSIQGAEVSQAIPDRFQQIGGLATYVQAATRILFGASPSIAMPGLSSTAPGVLQLHNNAQLPIPVMLTLLECTLSGNPASTTPSTLPQLAAFPKILHIQLVALRQVLNVDLVSGMETVLLGPSNSFTVSFPAPLTQQFALTTSAGKFALDGTAADQIAVGPVRGTFTLDFTPEASAGLHADYYEVTLRKIANGALSTERVYTVTSPSVKIDSALLTPNTDYAFEIHAITGHPQAAHGDFATVAYPYGMTIVYPRTVTTGPLQ